MNFAIWAEFAAGLINAVAAAAGADERSLRYLSLLSLGARARSLTDQDLAELKTKYEAEVAAGTPVTAAEIDELDARIAAASAKIQGS